MVDAFDVHPVDAVEVGPRRGLHISDVCDARVVDEYVDSAGTQDLPEGTRHVGLVGHVAAVGDRGATLVDDLLSGGLGGVFIQVENMDGSPAGSEGERDGPANTAAPTRYHGEFAVKSKSVGAHVGLPELLWDNGSAAPAMLAPGLPLVICLATGESLTL